MKTNDGTSSLKPSSIYLTCPACGSRLVYPLERIHISPRRWQLLLACPECFILRVEIVSNRELDIIIEQVESGLEEISSALADAERQHMEEECEKFIAAIQAGNIEPLDF